VVGAEEGIRISLAVVVGVGSPTTVDAPVCVSSAGRLELMVLVGEVVVSAGIGSEGAEAPVSVGDTAEPGALQLDRKHCCGKVCVM